jgi:hypothetical protein
MESGPVLRLQGKDIQSVELQVLLPILSVVSCFSICGFIEALLLAVYETPWVPFGVL